jgi:hypothetical protein
VRPLRLELPVTAGLGRAKRPALWNRDPAAFVALGFRGGYSNHTVAAYKCPHAFAGC